MAVWTSSVRGCWLRGKLSSFPLASALRHLHQLSSYAGQFFSLQSFYRFCRRMSKAHTYRLVAYPSTNYQTKNYSSIYSLCKYSYLPPAAVTFPYNTRQKKNIFPILGRHMGTTKFHAYSEWVSERGNVKIMFIEYSHVGYQLKGPN